jgi:hypothetical protein
MKTYKAIRGDKEFEFQTDDVQYSVVGYDCNIAVNSLHDALVTLRSLVSEGVMCRVKTESLFYVKQVIAISQDGSFIFDYYQTWREVPIK